MVRNRLDVYRKQTAPLVSYYEARPTFCRVNGAQLFDHVVRDLVHAIERALGIVGLPDRGRTHRHED